MSTAATNPTRGTGSYEALFVVGVFSQYVGAAIAVKIFDEIEPAGVAFLRILAAAIMVVIFRRSWRRSWTQSELVWAGIFGIVLAGMNLTIYLAIDELPLGTAVAIEFLGPIAVSAFSIRSLRNGVALAVAVTGVWFLAEVQPEGSTRGIVFALLAGAMWAAYIILGHRVARSGASVDGLGVGMAIGALALAVFGVPKLGPAVDHPWLLVLALATGLLSNVIPYGIDQVVLRRIARDRFALLQALLPVMATLIGFVALSQTPSRTELLGIALVIGALAFQTRPKQSVLPH